MCYHSPLTCPPNWNAGASAMAGKDDLSYPEGFVLP